LLEWADAVGLATYSVIGTAKALAFGVAPVPAVLMGVITGCAGGIIRDLLAGVPSILMRPELYVTAAALSAGLCAVGTETSLPARSRGASPRWQGLPCAAPAMVWKLNLPAYSRD